jgi:hypothetical protein
MTTLPGTELAATGNYTGLIDFGPGQITPPLGAPSAWLAVYEADGTPRWVQSFDGPSSDDGIGVGADDAGFVYFAMNSAGAVPFTNGVTTTQFGTYLAKLKPSDGGVTWLAQFGSGSGASGASLAMNRLVTAPSGMSVMGGFFRGNLTVVGGSPCLSTYGTGGVQTDSWTTIGVSLTGGCLWARTLSCGGSASNALDVAIDPVSQDSYSVGYLGSGMCFGDGTTAATVNNPAPGSLGLERLNSTGTFQAIASFPALPGGAARMVFGKNGRLWVAGVIDPNGEQDSGFPELGGSDLYLFQAVGFDLTMVPGTFKIFGSDGDDSLARLATAPNGDLFLAGKLGGSTLTFGANVLDAGKAGDAGMVLLRMRVQSDGGLGMDPVRRIEASGTLLQPSALVIDKNGTPLVGGQLHGTLDFGALDGAKTVSQTPAGLFFGRPSP